MPVIYDIETLSPTGLSPNDSLFMLDSSDATMSGSGSNKLESLQFFSQSPRTVEEKFFNLSFSEATDENLTLEFFLNDPVLIIEGNLLDPNGDTISRKTTFFKNRLLSSATHTTWNTEDDISISLNGGPGNKAYGVIEVARGPLGAPLYWSLQYFDDNAQLIGEWRAGNTTAAIPAGLTFTAVTGGGTPTITDNSKFAFTDSLEFSKTVSATNGIFLTESEINRVKSSIESLSYISLSNTEYSFQRTINPMHYQGQKTSLICSNLSSLQAHLIDLLLEDNSNFDRQEREANSLIADFFKRSSSVNPVFDISELFPIGSLSDVEPGERFVNNGDVIVESVHGGINENYNFMVGFLVEALNTTHSFVNLEIARRIKAKTYEDLFFQRSTFVENFIADFDSSINTNIVANNYLLLININAKHKGSTIKTFDLTASTIQSQDEIILSASSRKNIFSNHRSQFIGVLPDGQRITAHLSISVSDKADTKNITLDNFSEQNVNQTYSLVGSNEGKGFYLSQDERFEIIYGLTGSSPSVNSITFDGSSQEYTVALTGLDGGFSYEIEFDNIVTSTYNTSGTITGIKTDSQTLPISNNFKINLIETGQDQSVSFKLLESKSSTLNDPQSSGEFSFGDIKFLRLGELIDPNQTINPSWIIRSSDLTTGASPEEKDLFYHTGPATDSMSPLSLNGEDWVNISTNLSETSTIIPSGAEYTGNISISGDSILFEFKNLISGNSYRKSLPEFVEFESDPNIYFTSGSIVSNSEGRVIYNNGVSFEAQSSSHVAAVLYSISGGVSDFDIESLLQQNRDLLLLENAGGIIVDESHSVGMDQTITIDFVENEPLYFERSDIKISIPAGTTTGVLIP